MSAQAIEIYQNRTMKDIGVWKIEQVRLKVYGLIAEGQELSKTEIDEARGFVNDELPELIECEGRSNELGFVIIHSGDLGLTISAYWWVQGWVLCQHIRRRLWDSEMPISSQNRPVIGCVWELEIIHDEQKFWRDIMMKNLPEPDAYLAARSPYLLLE